MTVLPLRRPRDTPPPSRRRWLDKRFILPALIVSLVALIAALPGSDRSFVAVNANELFVIDGDTLDFRGERLRILNIDTPETGGKARCPREAVQAARATTHARTLVGRARQAEIYRAGFDRYGRTLIRLKLDGEDFARQMFQSGHARRLTGRRQSWC
jgi:micrococcal nuclease